ncbi:MAG: hypothetical protein IT165_25905 [Bryobacterales bacterium]|nr:hypothetical protein [Bryobacterales bacterium]
MKKTLVVVLALLFVGSAYAQDRLTAEVPFAFYVGNAKLPAGEYRVERPLANNHYLLNVRAVEEACSAFILGYGTTANKAPETAKLVFTKYADGNYFLSEIWHSDNPAGIHTFKSSRERESVTSRLVAGIRPETVVVLAKAVR